MSFSIQTDAEPIPGYRLLDRLGSGGFGEVWRCVAPGGIFKAVKVIHGDLRHTENDSHRFAEQELKALKRVKTVRHPYLLALDRFDIVDGRLLIVMELADCNLWDRFRECRNQGLPGIPREELLRYLSEAAEVLDLMNGQHSLQHLDVKPQNLFLLYNHVKVADFGQVKDLEKHVAQVTGGITPVYAAPETFDGFVSRFCDQYSLACVYQELLTGHRPFDGTSMQQLLMQHLQAPPNLQPSPPSDRPALSRALSKLPDDRYPTIAEMVADIRSGVPSRVTVPVGPSNPVFGGSPAREREIWNAAALEGSDLMPAPAVVRAAVVPSTSGSLPDSLIEQTYFPRQPADLAAPFLERVAPPEQTGEGPIRPTLILALGYTGFRVAQNLKRRLDELYVRAERLPAIRILYLDTDPEALESAATAFPPECIVPMRLNRSAYYLKPRNNGRMLTEGWFDTEILYKMPRIPVTMGIRSLARLAFCDHYRTVMQKIGTELDACLLPEALAATCGMVGQPLQTNRPRVYVVAGLGGGTGGGLMLDLAYAVRSRMKRIGYSRPNIVGLFLTPAETPDAPPAEQARANTYATLTELHHFNHSETAYLANFEDRYGNIVDNDPPFDRTILLPGFPYSDAGKSDSGLGVLPFPNSRGSGVHTLPPVGRAVGRSGLHRRPTEVAPDPTQYAAEILRLETLTPLGLRSAAELPEKVLVDTVRAIGVQRFGWPRAQVVERVGRLVCPVLLGHWVVPEAERLRSVVAKCTGDLWQGLALNPDRLSERFLGAADQAAGQAIQPWVEKLAESLTLRGWLSRSPDPAQLGQATDDIARVVGPPRENTTRKPGPLDEVLDETARRITLDSIETLSRRILQLLDDPEFRIAGAEEILRQILVAVDKSRAHLESELPNWETSATAAYDKLKHYAFQQKGVKKASGSEILDAFLAYPTDWLRALVARRAIQIYAHLHEALLQRLSELTLCRERLEELHSRLVAEAEHPAREIDGLLPVGCQSVEEAAHRFAAVLNDDDLAEMERLFQSGLETTFGGVFEASLNSADGPELVLSILRESTCDYLDSRLGEVDLAGMAKQRFNTSTAVRQQLQQMYDRAVPAVVGGGPWAKSEITIFAAPEGAGGHALTQMATAVLPPHTATVPIVDEYLVYREYPVVPFSALPVLGPAWHAAYQNANSTQESHPHARGDITVWFSVDE